MIALLRGRLVARDLDGVVLDVAGVGYRVHVAPGSVGNSLGGELTLHTHLAVREDALTLYGFPDPAARELFEVLLGVNGVGPKVALAAVATLGTDGLRRAVATEDVAAITRVPGIGRKGAQRIVLELRGRLAVDELVGTAAAGVTPNGTSVGRPPTPVAEVAEALGALGYGPSEVRTALERLGPPGEATTEQLLARALRGMRAGTAG